jgi:hypothetical protein
MANVKKILADREWIDAGASGLSLRSLEDGALPLLRMGGELPVLA